MELDPAVGGAGGKPPSVDSEGRGGSYTKDGSVDIKGRPILRSKTGGWKACSFIVGNYAHPLSSSRSRFQWPVG